MRHRDVRWALRAGAIADQFTGTVPNTTWGFGKLRINNSVGLVTTAPVELPVPRSFSLDQNYPNPFNPRTEIGFEVPVSGWVSLKVFDLLGREVATLANENMRSSRYQRSFDAGRLASGVYFYRLAAGGVMQTRKLMVLR